MIHGQRNAKTAGEVWCHLSSHPHLFFCGLRV